MNVLITGASGFLGGHVTEVFVASGHRVRALVRNTSRTELLEELGVEIVRGDLKDEASLRRAVDGIEVVVHAAATMAAPAQEFAAATVKGTRALLDAAEQAGVRRLVHVSSISVCSMSKPEGGVITEDTPYETDPRFLTDYVKSKLEAERAVLAFARRGSMRVLVLRPGLLYGPRGKPTLPRMGYSFGKNRFVLIGNGRNRLPACYVRNCARAVLRAAETTSVAEGVFTIVDHERFTQIEYLHRLKYQARRHLKIVRCPYLLARLLACIGETAGRVLKLPWPFRASHMIACHRRLDYSNEKARQVLNWAPETGKEEALNETMRFFARGERISRRANLWILGRSTPNAPPLTTCIIGCGMIAEAHLKALDNMESANVLALCDVNRDAARELARRFKVLHAYDDPRKMLQEQAPQVVHILTPPHSHTELTQLAAQHRAHIYVEKPMALSAPDARRMADLARSAGVELCVGHNHLYDRVMIKARKLVESGDLGEIIWVESYYGFDLGNNPHSRYLLPGGDRHWTFQIPGGLYQNLIPHPLSLALDLIGAPDKIQASTLYRRVLPHAPSDELRVLIETPRASGLITVSLAACPRFQFINIFGTKGSLFVDLLNKWIIPQQPARGIPRAVSRALMNVRHGLTVLGATLAGTGKVLTRRWTPYEGMDILIRELYAALQENRPSPITAAEGVAVMEVMDEIWRQIGPQGPSVVQTETR